MMTLDRRIILIDLRHKFDPFMMRIIDLLFQEFNFPLEFIPFTDLLI